MSFIYVPQPPQLQSLFTLLFYFPFPSCDIHNMPSCINASYYITISVYMYTSTSVVALFTKIKVYFVQHVHLSRSHFHLNIPQQSDFLFTVANAASSSQLQITWKVASYILHLAIDSMHRIVQYIVIFIFLSSYPLTQQHQPHCKLFIFPCETCRKVWCLVNSHTQRLFPNNPRKMDVNFILLGLN